MKNLIRTGLGMLILAVILIAVSALFMRAHAAGTDSEPRPLGAAVTRIVMTGPVDLALRQAASPALTVKGSERARARVTTRIEGDTLYIGTRGIFISFGEHHTPLVELNLPALEKLHIQGSGDARVQGFKGSRIDLLMRGSGDMHFEGDYQQVQAELSGSGDLTMNLGTAESVDLSILGSGEAQIRGQAKTLNARVTGSGDFNGAELKTASATLNAHGSSDVKVYASEEVKLTLTGSGDIYVYGKPAKRSVERRGSGVVGWE